jgi:lipopolysaccharide transport system ATP-binding protein
VSVAISAVGLSKRYAMPTAPDGWLDALRDVSLEVQEGEAVGLVGRNGAGKSTLLRILSRVTRPTAGHADVAGTVGALLEVGTGFHPELTGRENTFLSGAILGLSKRDVQTRFDEIVAFSEIEPFIDTPVKRYSSGMYARLGFAVAAHLRPSILIVDEVLAVGDLAFQAKCLAHMHRLTDDGTTVLFVSHNMLAVADLCPRALLLEGGRVVVDARSGEAISEYRRSLAAAVTRETTGSTPGLQLMVSGARPTGIVSTEPNAPLVIDVTVPRSDASPETRISLNVVIEDSDGRYLVHLRNDLIGADLRVGPGATWLRVSIESLPLAAGAYRFWARVASLDPKAPFILDSETILLHVLGEQLTSAIVAPSHRFERLHAPAGETVGVPAETHVVSPLTR